jgi:hypothetical protein
MKVLKRLGILTTAAMCVLGLAGCGKEVTVASLQSDYNSFVSANSSVIYNTDTKINLTSNIYGEDFKMNWDSHDSTERLIGTGDYHTYREVKAKAFEDELSERVDNTIIGGDRYTTYDGTNYFKTKYESNPTDGVLDVVEQIFGDSSARVTTNDTGNVISGKMEGPYLPYLFDKTSMTGLLDFKSQTDKPVKAKYTLTLDKKTAAPTKLLINLEDTVSIMSEVITGMSNDSGSVKTTVENFEITYTFKEFKTDSSIVVSDAMASASEVDNIDELSVMAVSKDSVEGEASQDIQIAGYKFSLSDAWKPVDVPGLKGYDTPAADGKNYSVTRLKYQWSEAKIDIMNPASYESLEAELEGTSASESSESVEASESEAVNGAGETSSGTSSGTSEAGEATEDVGMTWNIEELASKQVNADMELGYDSVYIDNDASQRYVMSSKGDAKKEYKFTVFGENDFLRFTVTTDGSELYADYYTEMISKIAETVKYVGYKTEEPVEEPETSAGDASTNETEAPEETTAPVEQLIGTAKNPYNAKDTIQMKGIDLNSGNIVTETAVVMNMNTDKILVEQKLKQAGITADGDAAIVSIKVTAENVKHTSESSVVLDMHVGLADAEGNQIGKLLNDGSPLGAEYADGIEFTQDNESKTLTFVFNVPDDFDTSSHLLQIRYNDPDLGDRNIFVRLK